MTLVGFHQTDFFDESEKSTSLNETAYLYVPAAGENGAPSGMTCRLHVAFDGCDQYVEKIRDLFIRDAGYNAWADANNTIVLYPHGCGSPIRLRSRATRRDVLTGSATRVKATSAATVSRCVPCGR